MKCICSECQGSGTIVCPECDGQGTYEGRIELITIKKNVEHYDELIELQRDAKRAIFQCSHLCELQPERRDSYGQQLKTTLDAINNQAKEYGT